MKQSEEILLEEVRSEYSRQMASWTDLTHKSHNFLQLNGLLLSIIFIGIGLQGGSEWVICLVISALLIITSIISAAWATRSKTVKEIKVDMDYNSDMSGKEREIMRGLIKIYNTAQKDIISKYNARKSVLDMSMCLLIGGLFLLLTFIALITVPIMVQGPMP